MAIEYTGGTMADQMRQMGSTTMPLSDYGVRADVEAPPAADAFDLFEMFQEMSESDFGEDRGVAPVRPPWTTVRWRSSKSWRRSWKSLRRARARASDARRSPRFLALPALPTPTDLLDSDPVA
jgi:hypothetical protein